MSANDHHDELWPAEPPPFVVVPLARINPQTLQRLLESVALREQSDYRDQPVALARRVELTRRALERGELVVVFEPSSETVSVQDPRWLGRTGTR